MPHGKLTVVVESATGIKDPTLHGRRDSYCTLQCGSQVLSTHIAEGGSSHPIFHTEFEFEIDRSTNELAISVFSKDTVRDDELVGYTVLDFKRVFYHGHLVPLTPYPLSRSSGKAGGYINISLKFKSRPSPYAQTAQNAHVPMRQHSAPPHAAPQQPQTTRNQHNPHQPSYPTGTEAYGTYEDGYGSSGPESSRVSRGSSRRSGASGSYRSSQSQPEQYYEGYEKPPHEEYYEANPLDDIEVAQTTCENYFHNLSPSPRHHAPSTPQCNHPRPSALVQAETKPGPRRPAVSGGPQVAMSSRPRQPVPGGPQLNIAYPYPQQQPPRVAMYAGPEVQVNQERLPQRPQVRQQQPQMQQQQVMMQGQQVPSMVARVTGQVAQAMAVGVARAGVQAVSGGFGDLLGALFQE